MKQKRNLRGFIAIEDGLVSAAPFVDRRSLKRVQKGLRSYATSALIYGGEVPIDTLSKKCANRNTLWEVKLSKDDELETKLLMGVSSAQMRLFLGFDLEGYAWLANEKIELMDVHCDCGRCGNDSPVVTHKDYTVFVFVNEPKPREATVLCNLYRDKARSGYVYDIVLKS